MSKIANDGLIRSDTGCFNIGRRPSCAHMATVGIKGLSLTRAHPCTLTAPTTCLISSPHRADICSLALSVCQSLKIGQGRAFCVSKICYWSATSVSHDVGLSCIQWRVSNRQGRPPLAIGEPYRRKYGGQLVSSDADAIVAQKYLQRTDKQPSCDGSFPSGITYAYGMAYGKNAITLCRISHAFYDSNNNLSQLLLVDF